MEWKTIDLLPQNIPAKEMIVVQAFNVSFDGVYNYTSDPVCTWVDGAGNFVRWRHSRFQPTHYLVLPESPK